MNSIGTFILKEQQPVPPFLPVLREGNIPLSFAQQRIWVHNQINPESPNNISGAVRIKGCLRSDVFQRAVDKIVERHEILRTTYSAVNGEPVQIVNRACPVSITRIDLTDYPAVERDAEIKRMTEAMARQIFNLSKDLMLKAVLLKLSELEQVFILTMHHIASDELSMEIFFRELLTLYDAFSEGKPSPLPDLAVQYADFSYWRRKHLGGESLQTRLSYWKNRLAGSPASLELPADRSRPAVRDLRGSSHIVSVPEALVVSLRKLSKLECADMSIIMLAAFKTLLYRYTGQGDICVGLFEANRNRPEIEGMIGFFTNILVLRTDLSDGPGFLGLLQREREAVLDTFSHYDMPFEKLVEALNPIRDPGRTPLFQVAFAYENGPKVLGKSPNLGIEFIEMETSVSLFDLSLVATESPRDMRLSFIYSSPLFDASTIERLAANFLTLLNSIASDPDTSIFTLPVLSDTDLKNVLTEWSSAGSNPPAQECIHELFEAQVERTPDAVAVVFEDRQFTYRELNARANQLAHYLRRNGVGPEVLVGICEERSLDMVAGIIGILKAGGAYVPLDPDYPKERLNLIVNDTNVSIILTHSRLSSRIPLHKGKVVFLDNWKDISLESKDNPANKSTPDNAACIFYTSGSTGTPKGAVIQHGPLVHFTQAVIYKYGLRPSDRILQFASINFDASAEEIYPCLSLGATLVLRSDEMMTDSHFLRRCDEWKLTVLSLPTAYWHVLTLSLKSENLSVPAAVRLLVIGGERALPDRLALWKRITGGTVRLLNTYGPTEATVVSTLFDPAAWNPDAGSSKEVPIGRPMPNVRIYILDTNLQPVPVGVRGELHIGGTTLSRGYLNLPDITAEKFIPDPFSKEPGARLYKTGDLARYLPDGNIEFAGRIDHQVKIRGFRIEVGEIEALLRQHPSVLEAVVVAREDTHGNRFLAAYILPDEGSEAQTRELRNYLVEKLPVYMVPSVFVLIDFLPLTPNNKVNRNALPPPDRVIFNHDKLFVPPGNSLERILTEIWEKVLDIRPVGIRDNFFEMGGHSLLAVRLITEVNKVTGKNLPVISAFRSPTIEQMAELIGKEYRSAEWISLTPVQPLGAKPPLFWVYGWQPLLSRSLDPDRPLYGFINQEKYGTPVFYKTIDEISALYIQEMRSIQPKGPYLIGGYCFGGMIALEMAHQLIRQGEEVSNIFLIDLPGLCLPSGTAGDDCSSHDNNSAAARSFSILKKLICFSFTEMAEYIERNTRYIIRQIKTRGQNIFKSALCRAYTVMARPLPNDLKLFYLAKLRADVINNYNPKVYPGRAVLFQADDGLQQDWDRLAAGGVEIHTVPGSGHATILEEPYAGTWANLLKKYLTEVQGP